MKIKPIEICDPKTLRDRERHWMRELNTLFPYGLNDRYDKDDLHDAYVYVTSGYPNSKSIYEHFNKVESRRSNNTSGTLNSISSQNQNVNRNNEIDCGRFLNDIISNHKDNLVKNLRAALFAFCKKNIEKMVLYSLVTTDIICSVTPFFMLVVKDLCMYKLNSMVTAKEANTSKQYL